MRSVIQRVSQAKVEIKGKIFSEIKGGILVLLGIEDDDSEEDIVWLSRKISNLRIFNDKDGTMNLSLNDTKGEIMVVSQFTLHASTKKGNRPSYIRAAKPEKAEMMYGEFIRQIQKECGKPVRTGIFREHMIVTLTNDGPVTIIIDTKNKE
jgi:D-aminoacyl-tRNA deacylase